MGRRYPSKKREEIFSFVKKHIVDMQTFRKPLTQWLIMANKKTGLDMSQTFFKTVLQDYGYIQKSDLKAQANEVIPKAVREKPEKENLFYDSAGLQDQISRLTLRVIELERFRKLFASIILSGKGDQQ